MGLTKYLKELVAETGIVSRDTLEVQGETTLSGDVTMEGGASVSDAPTASTGVARKNETDAVQSNLDSHENDTSNPHQTTAGQVGAPTQAEFNDHNSRHQDGGPDELDAGDLSGAGGTDGQMLQTDGTSASWAEPPSGVSEAEAEEIAMNRVILGI